MINALFFMLGITALYIRWGLKQDRKQETAKKIMLQPSSYSEPQKKCS